MLKFASKYTTGLTLLLEVTAFSLKLYAPRIKLLLTDAPSPYVTPFKLQYLKLSKFSQVFNCEKSVVCVLLKIESIVKSPILVAEY